MGSGEGAEKLGKKKKMKKNLSHKKEKLNLSQSELGNEEMEQRKKSISSQRKKRDRATGIKVEASKIDQYKFQSEESADTVKRKLSKKRKADKVTSTKSRIDKVDELPNELGEDISEHNVSQTNREAKGSNLRKKRRKEEKRKKAGDDKANEVHREVEDGFKKELGLLRMQDSAKSKEPRKSKKKDSKVSRKDEKMLEEKVEEKQYEVYEMSSGDEDCSRGMKKWITEYHQSRPGLKVLQDQIDDFIVAHEEQEEQAKKEREAQAAEGGWTVVVHHKGRKKTTEAETGTAVGSVAPAAVMENMAKKKSKEIGSNFYRFQKREAKMNEIMALQSKFEQDKKRIQQLRAARKFRPY